MLKILFYIFFLLHIFKNSDGQTCYYDAVNSWKSCNLPELEVQYGGYKLSNCGGEMLQSEVINQPQIKYSEANQAAWYSLIMVDLDAPYPEYPAFRPYLHWLIINIHGTDLKNGNLMESGTLVKEYHPSTPLPGSGRHRYQLFLFEQEGGTISLNDPGNRGNYPLVNIMDTHNLCPIAGFEFQVIG